MAKGKLEFDLDDFSDKKSFYRASNADYAYISMWDFDTHLRNATKYGVHEGKELSEKEIEIFDMIREKFHEFLENNNVSLDDLE
jgi:hypothetical protein